jgi:hypothetical protein
MLYSLYSLNTPSYKHCYSRTAPLNHRVHTEWQRPISGVHSIMMEKWALAGEGGGCTPTPFHSIYHHVQSCSVHRKKAFRYSRPQPGCQLRDGNIEKLFLRCTLRADTLPLFHLYIPLYVLCAYTVDVQFVFQMLTSMRYWKVSTRWAILN